MQHHTLDDSGAGDFYAVGRSGMVPKVVLEAQSDQRRLRLALTPEHARHLAQLLLTQADEVDGVSRKA